MIKKLYSAYYSDSGFPFHKLLPDPSDTNAVVQVNSALEINDKSAALIVWGGADINPKLYNHPESARTYPGGKRDWVEWDMMQHAIKIGIPIIGVCRGAQMACAAAGGYLIQHVDNHGGYGHTVNTVEGYQFRVNSIHHQMMYADETVDHELLAWSSTPQSPKYIYKKDEEFVPPADWKEPEFYYFPKIKGFAIQWHPEAMPENCPATNYVLEKIRERVNQEVTA